MNSSRLREAYTEFYYLQDCGGFETYRQSAGKVLDLRLECMTRLAEVHSAPRRVLDLGCGRGELTRYFAARGCQVQAVDYSASAMQLTEACLGGEPKLRELVTLQCASVVDPAIYHGVYDLVIASDLIEHLAPGELDELYRLVRAHLSADGIFVLHSYPNHWFYRYGYPARRRAAANRGEVLPEQPRSHFEQLMHINEQTPSGLRRQLCRQFEHVILWAGDHQQPVGSLAGNFSVHDWRDAPSLFAVVGCRQLETAEIISALSSSPPAVDAEPVSESAPAPAPEGSLLPDLSHAGCLEGLARILKPLKWVPLLGPLLRRSYHRLAQTSCTQTCSAAPQELSHPPAGLPEPDGWQRAYQQRFRTCSEELIKRLEVYLDVVAAAPIDAVHPLLDLGCGRGDWLALLTVHGYPVRGMDSDPAVLREASERGFNVVVGHALHHLEALDADSLGAVTAFHLVEHLPFTDVQRLLAAAWRVLVPGGVLIIETPNPENLRVASCLFYTDPEHVRPLVPALLEFAVEFAGFTNTRVMRLNPDDPEHLLNGEGELVERLNALLYGPRDFAVIATKGTDSK